MKRQCNQCGSELIFVKETVEEQDMPSPVTSVIYRCSDGACQDRIEKKAVAQAKYYAEQEKNRLNRFKNRSISKK